MSYQQAASRLGTPGNVSVHKLAASAADDLVPVKTTYQFYIQRLTYIPTIVAAQAITVRSKTTTTNIYALIPASQATPYTFNCGDEGLAITAGEILEAVSTAGPQGWFRVEGYYKKSTVQGMHVANQ